MATYERKQILDYTLGDPTIDLYSGFSVLDDKLSLSEWPIYGSARLGVLDLNEKGELYNNGAIPWTQPLEHTNSGYRQYEIANHLGNVLATISDVKTGVDYPVDGTIDFYTPKLLSRQDYYPFGMIMPGRNDAKKEYRFGFNGQEKTDEISGKGNHNTAEFWEYDTRLGRRWNIDPVVKPWMSSYHAFSNNPISKIDPNGARDHWVEDADGSIKWDKDAKSQAITKAGEKYLGKDLEFKFTSNIDEKLWDGPLGSFPTGDKLTSKIEIKSNEDVDGNLLSVDIISTYEVHATGGIFQGKNSFPGETNSKIDVKGFKSGSQTFEQHAMVNGFEEFGLSMMGYDAVNVAQKLILGLTGNKLSINAATDVFPSASLTVNGVQLFNYAQPSFKATHGKTGGFQDNGMGGVTPSDVSNRPTPSFYQRYKK